MSEVESPVTPLETASLPFVGQWNLLISTTNWEKGRIILNWRQALQAEDADPGDYADDAWAQRVGGVSGQHVGRLRRVFERFGLVYEQYEGLYWSHFQVAIDWDDAEMWLEGAAQNRWSVSGMRRQRAATLGELEKESDEAKTEDLAEFDESLEAGMGSPDLPTIGEKTRRVQAGEPESSPDGSEETPAAVVEPKVPGDDREPADPPVSSEPRSAQQINDISSLPEDLVDAFEAFKMAILRYRAEPWQTCALEDVTNVLMSLHELAMAPVEEPTS